MIVGYRSIVAVLMVSLLFAGPFAPLAAAQQPAQAEVMKDQPPTRPGEVQMGEGSYGLIAGFMTGMLIPGRALTCILGSGAGLIVMALTLGTQYKMAVRPIEEGCNGRWIVEAQDIMPSDKR